MCLVGCKLGFEGVGEGGLYDDPRGGGYGYQTGVYGDRKGGVRRSVPYIYIFRNQPPDSHHSHHSHQEKENVFQTKVRDGPISASLRKQKRLGGGSNRFDTIARFNMEKVTPWRGR